MRRGIEVLSYGIADSDLRLMTQEPTAEGQILMLDVLGRARRVAVPLAGTFQAFNVLAALGLTIATGLAPEAALEALPNGRSIPWVAPGGGNGAITPVETYLDANGAYCRQYTVTLTRDGIADEWHETACRRDAGDWRPERATENGA